MSNFNPIREIVIEGPDLSGKSTLYDMIHKRTSYKWNIQDRSNLSMLVHARYYGRYDFFYVENLKRDLYHLNNFMIILLPPWKVISKRFSERGDEIQNLISLKKLYNLFEEAANEFELFPNVITIRKEVDEYLLDLLVENLTKFEKRTFPSMSSIITSMCLSGNDDERVGVSFTSYDWGEFSDVSESDLNYESEKHYYDGIISDLIESKIPNEMAGANVHNRKEGLGSRRYIYTSNTCISLTHFLYRDKILDCQFFLRSSNVRDTLKYDLNFLKHLANRVVDDLTLNFGLPDKTTTKMNVFINSAHVPSIMTCEVKDES